MSKYFEDFTVGERFESGTHTVNKEEAVAFATSYDPQYFHTDPEKAAGSVFGKLAASGWFTAGISMRLKLETPLNDVSGGLIGMGVEAMRWIRAVYPGDVLRVTVTIVEKRVSQSKPNYGVVRYKVETRNQNNEVVMEMTPTVLMPLKKAA